MNKNRYTLKNYTAATKKLITLLLFVFFCVSCQSTVCIEEMVWQNNNLKSVSLQPKVIRFLEKNYCGFSLDINRKWCTMEMATHFEDSFLKGDIFQMKDTVFLKSDNGKVSPLLFWANEAPREYIVNSLVTSRRIDDNFTKGYPFEFEYKVSRDTIFNYNGLDTIQRIRIKNFQRFNNSGLVLVVSKSKGIQGIYVSNHRGIRDSSNVISSELIYVSDGNIYLETIPFAKIFDPKTMNIY